MDFEDHVCCHEYDLGNITTWQHIGGILVGGVCGNKSATNLAPPLSHKSILICGAGFFQI